MPRFFFHIRDRARWITDDEGMELPDLKAAVHEMKLEIADMKEEAARNGEDIFHQIMEIVDEDGLLLASVPFRDANESDK